MTVSRRSALGYGSGLALTGGTVHAAVAGIVRDGMAAARQILPAVGTAQRFNVRLVHRDQSCGTDHFATISIPSQDSAWAAYGSLDVAAYDSAFASLRGRGYHLRRLGVFQTAKGLRFAPIWQLALEADWQARYEMAATDLEKETGRLAERGYRLTGLHARGTEAGARYAAIWERTNGAPVHMRMALTGAELEQTTAAMAAEGYRPRQISGFAAHGGSRYAAIFDRAVSAAWQAHHRMHPAAFAARSNVLAAQGYHLADASGHVADGHVRLSGIWEKA